ncbi:MAG: AHH domain-containing protein [Phycisphaerae bacterium]|nr:AHH domain-containing protein [Phycisphaerae bacterium]
MPTRLPGQYQTPLPSYPTTCEWPSIGKLVKAYVYDGVGRLVRTSSPLEAPDGWHFVGDEEGQAATATMFTRSERFLYDGTRCVQEVVTDPVVVDLEGNPVASLGSESDQRGGEGGGGGSTGELPMLQSVLRAQYVWGPGDGINGADELLCQLDPRDTSSSSYAAGGGKPYYPLTDAQGDVVALVHVPLVGIGSNPIVAEVAGQWTYSPYGEVLSYEQFHPHPALVYGHKTLRVDRLDGEALTWEYDGEDPESMAATGTFFETRRLEPGARLLSYARNRTLDTKRGRWLQLDPNASGIALVNSTIYHGTSFDAASPIVNVESRSTDGPNICEYSKSNAVMHSDNFGLYSTNEFVEDFYGSNFSMPTPSSFLTGALSAMVETYAANQEWDVDWASDWSQGDDWSTRNDNSWVLESAVQGIYDTFEVGWGDYKANPLDYIGAAGGGGGNPASSPGSKNATRKGLQEHHIATREGSYKHDFEIEFKKAGMTLDDLPNRIAIPHGGRHPREYHEFVLKRVKKAVGTKSPAAAKAALTAELKDLGKMIKSNQFSGFLYDTVGGKKTGWKGLREKFAAKWGKGKRKGRR